MKKILVTIGCGLLVWAIPFACGVAIMPHFHTHDPMFDTIVVLAMIAGTTAISLWYLGKTGLQQKGVAALLGVGLVWMLIAIAVDLPIMVYGPVGMSLHEYMADIGLTYLGLPIILAGIGFARNSSGA